LAKNAGGYGSCRDEKANKPAVVFESKDDPDYQVMLAAIRDAKALHDSDPRWDTPGWKAPPEYIREMKRHGIIPESFDREKDTLDPHETDKRYWGIVAGHHPPGKEPELYDNPAIKALCIKGTMSQDGSEIKLESASLTTGKPSSSSSTLNRYFAHYANNGSVKDTNEFWATDVRKHPGPAWWQVDLEKPTDVGRVVVVGYYDDNRYYGFTVETSLDGKTWGMAADKRDNKEQSTAKGYTCTFKQRKARYIRITQTNNSINTGRHLVEVMAYVK